MCMVETIHIGRSRRGRPEKKPRMQKRSQQQATEMSGQSHTSLEQRAG